MNLKIFAIVLLQVLVFAQCQEISTSTTEKDLPIENAGSSMSSPAPAAGSDENPNDSKPNESLNFSKEESEDKKDQEQADEAPPAHDDNVLANIPVTTSTPSTSSSTVAPTRPTNVVSSTTPPPLVHNTDAANEQKGRDMNAPATKKDKNASSGFRESMVLVFMAAIVASFAGRF